jgi:hypothetical protein
MRLSLMRGAPPPTANGRSAMRALKRQIATALTRRVAPCPRVGAATPPPTRGRKSTLTPILRQFFMTKVRSVLATTAKTSVRERDPPAHVAPRH